MKIENDKYYTSIELANECWNIVDNTIGLGNVTDIIEPSCGNGAFYHYKIKPNIGYDIQPQMSNYRVKACDYLTESIEYKKGRLIIGNPPYGSRFYLGRQFLKKSSMIADYVAFILPISQLNNKPNHMYLQLVKSIDLGESYYTDRKLHCCFNIYRRTYTEQIYSYKLKDITICRQDSSRYEKFDYDIRMCYWGDGTVGKILLSDAEHYSGEYKIKINNQVLYNKIYNTIINIDWKKEISGIAMKRLKQWQIVEILKREIPEIK